MLKDDTASFNPATAVDTGYNYIVAAWQNNGTSVEFKEFSNSLEPTAGEGLMVCPNTCSNPKVTIIDSTKYLITLADNTTKKIRGQIFNRGYSPSTSEENISSSDIMAGSPYSTITRREVYSTSPMKIFQV